MNVVLLLLAGTCVAAAAASVACRRMQAAVRAFAILLAASAALCALLGAGWLAAAVLLAAAAGTALFLKGTSARLRENLAAEGGFFLQEPILAGAAGVALSVVIAGTLHDALSVEWQRTLDFQSRRDRNEPRLPALPLPAGGITPPAGRAEASPWTALAGALVLTLGATGFLVRRGLGAVILSAGVTFHGALLTLAAFGAFHGNRAGQAFALAALAAAVAAGGVSLGIAGALTRRDEPLDLARWRSLRDEEQPADFLPGKGPADG